MVVGFLGLFTVFVAMLVRLLFAVDNYSSENGVKFRMGPTSL